TVLAHHGTNFRRRAHTVVGQRLDNEGDAARTITFVADFLGVVGIGTQGRFDGALHAFIGHVGGTGGNDGSPQLGVGRRIVTALFDGKADLTTDLVEDFRLLSVLRAF